MRRLFREGLSDFKPLGPLLSEVVDPKVPEEPDGPSSKLATPPLPPANAAAEVEGPLLL